MLNLGLSFLHVVGTNKIYTEFVTWIFLTKLPLFLFLTLYINLCLVLTNLSDYVIFIYYVSYWVYTIIDDASTLSNTIKEIKEHVCFM